MPKFENKFTTGNVVAIATFILMCIGGLLSISQAFSAQDSKIAVVTTRVDNVEVAYRAKDIDLSSQMHETKIELKGAVKDLGIEVKAELQEIKRRLK